MHVTSNMQVATLKTDRQDLLAESKKLWKALEDTKVEAAFERGLRREHQGHAYLLAKERERLLQTIAKLRHALKHLLEVGHACACPSNTNRACAC